MGLQEQQLSSIYPSIYDDSPIVSDDDSPILRETVHLDIDRLDGLEGLGISKTTIVDVDAISDCARSR